MTQRRAKKTCRSELNPRRIPRTQADVDRAREDGINIGVENAAAIFLTVLVDKFNGRDYIQSVWDDINKLSESVAEHRVSIADLKRVLRDEYDIHI